MLKIHDSRVSRDGELVYEEVGQGAPLVLLHGFGANRTTWSPWLEPLAANYRCINVDLKGFGEAPLDADGSGWGIEDLAAAVVRLVHELDLSDVTLIGHSMGGGVALLAALELLGTTAPEGRGRVARLVSLCGAAYPQRMPRFIALSRHGRWVGRMLQWVPKHALVQAIYRTVVADPEAVTRVRVEAMAAPMRRPGAMEAMVRVAQGLVPELVDDVVAQIPRITVPVLCLWGRHDRIVPPWVGRRLASEVPKGEYVELVRCAHMPHEEQTEAALAVVLEFLHRTGAQAFDRPELEGHGRTSAR